VTDKLITRLCQQQRLTLSGAEAQGHISRLPIRPMFGPLMIALALAPVYHPVKPSQFIYRPSDWTCGRGEAAVKPQGGFEPVTFPPTAHFPNHYTVAKAEP